MHRYDNTIQDQLKQLDQVPEGYSFDEGQVWQRLEDRLRTQHRNNTRWWLRFAAVFIMLALPAVLFINRPKPASEMKDVSKRDAPARQVTDRVTGERPAITINNKQDKSVASSYRSKKGNTLNETQVSSVAVDTAKQLASDNLVTIVTPPTTNDDLNKIMTSQNPDLIVKKPKLKVIHLNDLYAADPMELVKMSTKRQASTEPDPEPAPTTPSRSFWKSKSFTRIPISLTDNQ